MQTFIVMFLPNKRHSPSGIQPKAFQLREWSSEVFERKLRKTLLERIELSSKSK